MFKEKLKQYVLDNPRLVSMKPAGDDMFVLKYKKRVFYDDLWNEFLEHCRGAIIDADFDLVSYPFTKIYNLGIEKSAPQLPEFTKVTAFRKINGFMVAMTWHNNRLIVSTTGSTESDYVNMAIELMGNNRARFEDHCQLHADQTFMFECVHRDDPHIIPEREGLYLLGCRLKEWQSPIEHDPLTLEKHADAFGTIKVGSIITTLDQLERMAKECKFEGYVFYCDDGVSAKIKSPYYLVHKAIARKKDILSLNKELVDEEYFPLISHLTEIKDSFNLMTEQDRLIYIRKFLDNKET